jgi:hypothetical protein
MLFGPPRFSFLWSDWFIFGSGPFRFYPPGLAFGPTGFAFGLTGFALDPTGFALAPPGLLFYCSYVTVAVLNQSCQSLMSRYSGYRLAEREQRFG